MSDTTAPTSRLTVANTDTRLPARDENEFGKELAAQSRRAAAGETLQADELECRPFQYEEIALATEGAPGPPRAGSRADCRDSSVELLESEGVVREFVVTCSCGRRTRLRIDYGVPA